MNPSVGLLSNHIRDTGQERHDSLQYPVPLNNINVSLAEGQTVGLSYGIKITMKPNSRDSSV